MNVNNICEAVTCHQSVRSKSITSFERLILINLKNQMNPRFPTMLESMGVFMDISGAINPF